MCVFRSPEDGPPEAGYVCSFVADDQGNASVKNGFLDSRVQARAVHRRFVLWQSMSQSASFPPNQRYD